VVQRLRRPAAVLGDRPHHADCTTSYTLLTSRTFRATWPKSRYKWPLSGNLWSIILKFSLLTSSVARGLRSDVAAAGGETPTAGVSPPASFAQNCTEYHLNLVQFQLRQFSKAIFNQCRYEIQIRRPVHHFVATQTRNFRRYSRRQLNLLSAWMCRSVNHELYISLVAGVIPYGK